MIHLKANIFFLAMFILLGSFQAESQSAKKPFRIGIAGLTHDHVHGILARADDGDIEIVGIAEPNRALAERYLNQYKLPLSLWFPSLEEMLDKTRPEAVTAFNSIYEHLAVVKTCAPRKIHVMVEKPLAVSLDHAKQMQALIQQYGIQLLTNYETTWYGSNLKIEEEYMKKHTLGALRKVVIHDGHQGPKEIGCSKEFLEWLTDPVKNGGGAIMDFGCYGANLLTWLTGGERPLSVVAVTQQMKPLVYPGVDDEATVILMYAHMQGIIQASWNWPFGRKDMEIYGEKGSILADRQGARLKTQADKQEEFFASAAIEKPYHDPFAYLAAVVRGEINSGPADLSSLENNVIVVEILEAAKLSAKEGRAIQLR